VRPSTTAHRRLPRARAWSTGARHTIKIVVAHPPTRPTVAIDGVAHLR
jgi:hypothetical protein